MEISRPATRFYLPLLLILLGSLAIMTAFLPLPGIQEDEALFLVPFLKGHATRYAWTIGDHGVAVMLMDYIGALKTWIYWPIFKVWPPGVWSIRLPVCLFSLLTVAALAAFLRRVAGSLVAILTAMLLATDAPFILTGVFDWGPVCLLLLSTALFLLSFQRFASTGQKIWLSAAFFFAGLATWYKPLFLVVPVSLALSCLIVFPRRMRPWLKVRNLLTVILSFIVGSAPLILFNLQRGGGTFRAGRDLPSTPVGEKLMMLRHTLDGRALEHYMFRSFPGEAIPLTGKPASELIAGWYGDTSFHPAGLLLPAFIVALVALPFLRRSPLFRPLLLCWIAFAIAETAMLSFRDAGAGPHHTVLLYPAPQFIVAATICACAGFLKRPLARGLVVWALGFSLTGANLWLLHSYYEAGKRNGFSVYWTDGIENLAHAVAPLRLPVAILDWGLGNGLQVMAGDQIQIVDPAPVRAGVLYLAHCDGFTIDESRSARYRESLRPSRVVRDREGQPVFCVFSLAPAAK